MIELNEMVKELNLFGLVTYYYKVPRRDLYHGLRHLTDDSDCVEMVQWVKLSKTIEVYLETQPLVPKPVNTQHRGIVSGEVGGNANEHDHWDGEGEGSESYSSESEESTDLEDFVDSEVDDVEDDRLFDMHVDKNVEWGGLSKGKGKDPISNRSTQSMTNEDSDAEAQSDELVSLYGSSDEERGPPRERHRQFNKKTDMIDPKFKVGMIFPTREIFKEAVREHSIKTGKRLIFTKNDTRRVRVVCKPPPSQVPTPPSEAKKNPCEWALLASKMQGNECFQVRTYESTHNCQRMFHNKQVTAKWLSNKYVETLRSNPTWPVKSFKDQVQKDHKVGVSRAQLYKAKGKAFQIIEGDYMEQYTKLPDYCEELRRTNPGTTITMKTIEDERGGDRSRFERLYVC
ncbi:uncharacterized protein LOC131308155 [Rhododendron vialii]|uniref:uncharacterized protein LOC131308155 n=1 Tax=Rhododendron vialii TaxID=182163 RepID=UPI00265FBBCB|nr:uncharacterized protein LOC131308155 [Rhododendron vialii]